MKPVLEAKDIHMALGGQEVLRGVSLSLDKGQLKVLIGPSGGGKSTFLQCLNHLHAPDKGDIFLEGVRLDKNRRGALSDFRRRVGMIFQDFNLFDHMTAVDNCSIALRKVLGMGAAEARRRAMEELARVGMADRSHLYPAQLSGGQKQRVSIARALAMDPVALLLDEPTSALDPELIGEVLAVIKDLAQSGMTMVMATHQTSFAKSMADAFIFMEAGRIVEEGSPEELLAAGSGSRTKAFCAKLEALSATGDEGDA